MPVPRAFRELRLVNGSTGDPALFVDDPGRDNAILIDAGENASLGDDRLGDLEAVLLTHHHVDHFVGIDVSPRMIERARATGLYEQLEVDDMVAGLRGKADASADLVLAADAFVYVQELAPVLTEVQRVLAVGGLFAFTVETHAGEGVVLGEGLRYAHAADHVRKAVAASGLTLAHLEAASARNEDNEPAPGLVAVAAKT